MAETKTTILSKAADVASFYVNKWGSKLIEFAESFSPTTAGDWTSTPTTQDAALNELGGRTYCVAADDALTTAGGAAAEVATVTGAAEGDLVVWSVLDGGTSSVTGVSAVAAADQVTFTFSGDPGADTIISYAVFRPTSA